MNTPKEKILLAILGVLLIAVLILQERPPAASQSTQSTTTVGRYQLGVIGVNSAYIIDTTTGQTWRREAYGAAAWEKQAPLPKD